MRYKVSVMVTTYNPQWEKLKLTLNSILMQRNVEIQLIITDDGSESNLFELVEEHLINHGFTNYILTALEQNQGTVQNCRNGINYCTEKYLKTIGQGDFLSGEDMLFEWCTYMEKTDAVVCFCDAVYYTLGDRGGNNYQLIKANASPQSYKNWAKHLYEYYVLYGDIGLGAAIMLRREVIIPYLEMISGKVVYAEDNIYRIMAASGKKFTFFESAAIYYEYGTGISTQRNAFWHRALTQDWRATNELLMEVLKEGEKNRFVQFEKFRNYNNRKDKIMFLLRHPKWLCYKIRKKIFARKTSSDFSLEYIHRVEEY